MRLSSKTFIRVTINTAIGLLILLHSIGATGLPLQNYQRPRLGAVDIPFVINQGQLNKEVVACAATLAGMVYITEKGEIVYLLDGNGSEKVIIKEQLSESKSPGISFENQMTAKINSFVGNDHSKWRSNIPCYQTANFGEIFEGIELQLKAYANNIEKFLIVNPGGDPRNISFQLNGIIQPLEINNKGELEIITNAGSIQFTRPIAFQEIDGVRKYVEVAYSVDGESYGFSVGDYDKDQSLFIDPLLASTYLGGSAKDGITEVPMVIDAEGNIYVASRTKSSVDFPVTSGSYQEDWGGGANDIFIAKFDPELTTLLAATYLGGTGDEGIWPGLDLEIDPDGNVIVAGRTSSINFPKTTGVLYENRVGGFDAFISKLNPDLDVLLASTYFGGSGNEYYIQLVVDENGDIVIAGSTASSTDFPITGGAYDPTFNGFGGGPYPGDIFVSRISSDLATLIASTYLGGNTYEYCEDILIDADGNIFLTGWTGSSTFPRSVGAYDESFNGGVYDAFVTCLSSDLTTLVASTYLGGSEWDFGYGMTINDDGEIYISGHTASGNSSYRQFPVTSGSYQETYGGGGADSDDAFVSKFNHSLTTLMASTYYGGSGFEIGTSIKIGQNGRIYLAGTTTSSNLDIPDYTIDSSYNGSSSVYTGDAFAAILDGDLSEQYAFTYLGGAGSECLTTLLLDNSNNIFISGATNSGNFPVTTDAYQTVFAGGGEGAWVDGDDWGGDIYIARFNFDQFTRISDGPQVSDAGRSSSVCWVDYDDDGDLDLYVGNAGYPDIENNCLYRNNNDGTFSQIEGIPIVSDGAMTTSTSWADYDNDGDLDLFVANHRSDYNIFYENDGMGNFTENTSTPIDDNMVGSTTMSWIDFNLDGFLDIFVGNSTASISVPEYPPYRNFLYQGDGVSFTEITEGDIVTRERHTYGASWCDYDNDGDPDLVTPNNVDEYTDLYRNEGGGFFTHLSTSPVCFSIVNGGGSSWSDYDNDGDMDLFIGSFSPGPSYLFRNDAGDFVSVADHGLGITLGRANGGIWGDYDNDGDEDIYIWHTFYPDPNLSHGYIFENLGDGNFEKITEGAIANDNCTVSAAVWGDYDRDGDLDLYFANYDPTNSGNVEFLKNELFQNIGNSNNWITIKPTGTVSNRSAIGTKIMLKANIDGVPVWQMRELSSQTASGTQGPLELHFGLGDAPIIDSIKVEWPGGQITDILTDIEVNQFLTVAETVCGDVNEGVDINILDIVYLINYKYKSGPEPVPYYTGDVNSDAAINILDIVYLINYVYKNGPDPDCP